MKRVVIDTNAWISYLIGKRTKDCFKKLFLNDHYIVLCSYDLLQEITEVMNRPKFKKYFSADDKEKLLFYLRNTTEFVHVVSDFDESPDKDDNFLLNLSFDGKADYLVTGDKNDLLKLHSFQKTKIIGLNTFCAKL